MLEASTPSGANSSALSMSLEMSSISLNAVSTPVFISDSFTWRRSPYEVFLSLSSAKPPSTKGIISANSHEKGPSPRPTPEIGAVRGDGPNLLAPRRREQMQGLGLLHHATHAAHATGHAARALLPRLVGHADLRGRSG